MAICRRLHRKSTGCGASAIGLAACLILGACSDVEPDGSLEPVPLDEASTAHVVTTINRGEIALANVAQFRSDDQDVIDYANRMVADHTTAQAMIDTYTATWSITPADNAVSMQLTQDAEDAREGLGVLTSPELDTEYMQSQIAMHREALRAIDTMLVPGTDDPELLTVLMGLRVTVSSHLLHAIMLQRDLRE